MMMKSANQLLAERLAKQYSDRLEATDDRFSRSVLVMFDGGIRMWENAFAIKVSLPKSEDWLMVFPEHDDPFVIELADVHNFYVFLSGPVEFMDREEMEILEEDTENVLTGWEKP